MRFLIFQTQDTNVELESGTRVRRVKHYLVHFGSVARTEPLPCEQRRRSISLANPLCRWREEEAA